MEKKHAEQIANLLNTRNKLEIKYDSARVLRRAEQYLIDLSADGDVRCCSQVKNVQWYQAEICHVTTHPDFEGSGLGKAMVKRAEERAKQDGARLLQCTIRVGNEASEGLFTASDFIAGPVFHNPDSGNNVRVWSKPLYPQKGPAK